jgi:group I intron endonuclease
MVYGHIYKIENTLNGKVYIGQTIQSPSKRMWSHFSTLRKGIHKNQHLQNSFNKYGEPNFKFTVLNYATNKETLDKLESNYIKKYNSVNKNLGYNKSLGGANGKQSLETRKKRSKMMMGENNPNYGMFGEKNSFYGKKHSLESRNKMSESLKGKMAGENHPFYGKKLSDEHKRNISESKKGKNHQNYGKHLTVACRENIRKAHKGMGLFGFTGGNYHRKENPEKKCWQSKIRYNGHPTYLGYYQDPLSCEIVYNLVLEEIRGIK